MGNQQQVCSGKKMLHRDEVNETLNSLNFLLSLHESSDHFMHWVTVKWNQKKKRQSQTLPHTYDWTQWKAVMQTLIMRSLLCLGFMPPCELQLAAGSAIQHLSHVSSYLAAVKVRLLQSYPYLGQVNRARKSLSSSKVLSRWSS